MLSYPEHSFCDTGFVCTILSEWFYQCLPPGSGSSTVASTSSTTTVSSTSKTTTATSRPSGPTPTGFVTTSGTKFMLNGAPYTVVGSNAYWPALLGYNSTEIDQAFSDIAGSGATTVRTMGFNEVTSPTGIYFYLWTGATATVNTGPTGLGALDILIASAKAHGIRLIIALTNNWSNFGGMDVYTAQLLGPGLPHDTFLTNPTVIPTWPTFKQSSRGTNEPTIMVPNEPRCAGTSTVASPTCNTTTITNWAAEISAYIKSIDQNHLVGIGDEGFFNDPSSSDYVYQGSIGVDFLANMAISTLDFGTFHNYPDGYGEENKNITQWGSQWITDHATVMSAQNKPVIMEEFGLTTSGTAREMVYAAWYSTVLSTGLTGDLVWQAGSVFSTGPTPSDGYSIYPTDPVYALIQSHATAMEARDKSK
ncbi:mannanase [Mycena sanguinolenta]|nr:mannanase [Mycena sanguinolenta]